MFKMVVYRAVCAWSIDGSMFYETAEEAIAQGKHEMELLHKCGYRSSYDVLDPNGKVIASEVLE